MAGRAAAQGPRKHVTLGGISDGVGGGGHTGRPCRQVHACLDGVQYGGGPQPAPTKVLPGITKSRHGNGTDGRQPCFWS